MGRNILQVHLKDFLTIFSSKVANFSEIPRAIKYPMDLCALLICKKKVNYTATLNKFSTPFTSYCS